MATNNDIGQNQRGVMKARTAFMVMVVSLLMGSLFNAHALDSLAGSLTPGPMRTVATATTGVLTRVSSVLWLDQPRRLLESLLRVEHPGGTGGARPIFLPTPNRPALLMVAGDSLVDPFGPEMVTTASATGVVRGRWEVRFSSGLTRPQIFDWAVFFDEELARNPADIVVFMVGANDSQPIETADGWVSSDTPEWEAEYRARIDRLMTSLTELTATVYWVGQPIARSGEHSEKMARLNSMYRSVADDHEWVRYVDSWEVFADEEGHYTDFLPDHRGRPVLVRQPDGIHLTSAGARLLAEVVLDAIRLDWSLTR